MKKTAQQQNEKINKIITLSESKAGSETALPLYFPLGTNF
jgi:hypothetical protein